MRSCAWALASDDAHLCFTSKGDKLMLTTIARRLFSSGRAHRVSRAARRPRLGRTLIVEAMEGRTLLSMTVNNAFGLGSTDITSTAVVSDAAGNTYVAGGFQGTVNFSPTGRYNLASRGSRDIFLAKYSPSGALVWADAFGGAGIDLANAVALDSAGNLYLAGS